MANRRGLKRGAKNVPTIEKPVKRITRQSTSSKKLKTQTSLDNSNECASSERGMITKVGASSTREEPAEPTGNRNSTMSLGSEEPQEGGVAPSNASGLHSGIIDVHSSDSEPEKDDRGMKLEDRSERMSGGSAMDALFNGKKEITLNRKKFVKILKSYVSQYAMTLGPVGRLTQDHLKMQHVIDNMKNVITSNEKQRNDYKTIVRQLIEDREAHKQRDETLSPVKVIRSYTVGSDILGRHFSRQKKPGPADQIIDLTGDGGPGNSADIVLTPDMIQGGPPPLPQNVPSTSSWLPPPRPLLAIDESQQVPGTLYAPLHCPGCGREWHLRATFGTRVDHPCRENFLRLSKKITPLDADDADLIESLND